MKRRMSVKAIKARHEHAQMSYSIGRLDTIEYDDVSFVEFLLVHEDRGALLAEVKRLRAELRKARALLTQHPFHGDTK